MAKRGGGFTLIELLVVVSIIALLISILLPSLGKAKELANRAHCSANLRGITQSLIVYAQDQDSSFPAPVAPASGTTYARNLSVAGVSTSADAAMQLLSGNQQGSPLACLWMLNLRNQAAPKLFLCKSDKWVNGPAQLVDGTAKYFDNFQSPYQISYSISNPWSSTGALTPLWRGRDQSSSTPIASDMAPLSGDNGKNTALAPGSTSKDYNSDNHEGAGQNVSYADSHVEFVRNPYVGCNNDNIFTVGGAGMTGAAATLGGLAPGITSSDYPYDTVMTPIRQTSTGSL